MSESKEIRTMRYMEWQRVKGGLQAILHSYWDNGSYREVKDTIEKFMKDMHELIE